MFLCRILGSMLGICHLPSIDLCDKRLNKIYAYLIIPMYLVLSIDEILNLPHTLL